MHRERGEGRERGLRKKWKKEDQQAQWASNEREFSEFTTKFACALN